MGADGAVLFEKSPHPYCFTQVSYQAPTLSEGLFSEGAIFAPVASNTAISDLRSWPYTELYETVVPTMWPDILLSQTAGRFVVTVH